MKAARSLCVLSLSLLLANCSGGSGGGPAAVPPTGLSVQTRATSLFLSWVDDSAAEVGFAIERADDVGPFRRIAEVGPNITLYEDRGLKPVSTYHYRVQALIPGGGEVVSATVTAKTVAPSFTHVTPGTAFTPFGQRVTLRGDGFSAGVVEVLFNGRKAVELLVVDDSTLTCTTPSSTTSGFASVTLVTLTSTSQQVDNFTFYTWPPVYQTPPADIVASAPAAPSDVQTVSDGTTSHMVWSQDKPRRAIFAARGGAHVAWSKPTRLDSGSGLPWHPHIAVDGSNVYVVWSDLGVLFFVKSEDAGGTWTTPVRIPAKFASVFHPKVVAQGRRVHVFWTDERAGHGELYDNTSRDGGQSFGKDGVRVNTGLGVFNLQVAIAGQHIYLVWWNPDGLGGQYFNRSTDAGETWAERDQKLAFQPGTLQVSPPQLVAANGHVFVLSPEEKDQVVSIVRSSDGGAKWDAKHQLNRFGYEAQMPRMAVTPNGKEVYVVWHDPGRGTAFPTVRLNRSLDGGASFMSSPALVATVPGSTGTTPVVCCNGGIVTVAFANNVQSIGSEIFVSSSSEWGLRWQTAKRLSERDALFPQIHCHGADVLINWLESTRASRRYALRAVRTTAR